METERRVTCPSCGAVVREGAEACVACGELIPVLEADRLAAMRHTTKTITWGTPKDHVVLLVLSLVCLVAGVACSVTTPQVLGVLPCVPGTLYWLFRRGRHDREGATTPYRFWVKPTSESLQSDTTPVMAAQRVVVTQNASGCMATVMTIGCVLWPILLLLSARSALAQQLVAQTLVWIAAVLAYVRSTKRDKESEATVVEVPIA